MPRKRAAFIAALLRESVAFVTGLLIGRAWQRRSKPMPTATEALAEALQYAEKTRNARKDE